VLPVTQNTALLVIDAQVNMFAEGRSVFEGDKILQRIGGLIAKARARHVPIIYIQNNGTEIDPDFPGTPGWEIHPAVAPGADDIVIQKWAPDSFRETTLQSTLDLLNIRKLVIAGMQTEFCVDATCRRACALGYDVTLVKDAHSTYDGEGLTAPQIIAQHNEALGAMARLEEASSITFE
jgi:nicotinamidase-related amidase